ncbi:hypothetical protein [Salinarimonas ramus]|uniref:Uncharacterized protein n=1 Tax=Salinarimonas ramus TaxID=690164 RepID=A0A917Q5A0_9HYPH|nr:hypothetical protein [Salinarimonas ramus]GGK22781.1 hypothetical protein GCM10011322_06870 [Salinarimonas ramus]
MAAAGFTDLADLPLTPDGVRALRRRVYGDDDAISLAEGEMLFDLARAVGERGCREWRDFFCEAAADLLVHQIEPRGYLGEAEAAWLIARLDGRPALSTEFAALLKVMEFSRSVPDRLAGFALNLVKDVVLTGEGEAITGQRHEPGRVTRADVDALRRVLFVASSEGFGHVTRTEADVLFDIADETADAPNDASFPDLFARAIGNHLLAGPGRHAPTRLQVMRREEWLDQRRTLGSGIAATFGSMAANAFGIFGRDAAPEAGAEASVSGLTPERVDDEELTWLVGRIERRPGLSPAERALLAFLVRECADLAPPLRRLAAAAA